MQLWVLGSAQTVPAARDLPNATFVRDLGVRNLHQVSVAGVQTPIVEVGPRRPGRTAVALEEVIGIGVSIKSVACQRPLTQPVLR